MIYSMLVMLMNVLPFVQILNCLLHLTHVIDFDILMSSLFFDYDCWTSSGKRFFYCIDTSLYIHIMTNTDVFTGQ